MVSDDRDRIGVFPAWRSCDAAALARTQVLFADDATRHQVDDTDGIVVAIGDERTFAIGRDGDAGRRRSLCKSVGRGVPELDWCARLSPPTAGEREDVDVVLARTRNVERLAVGRESDANVAVSDLDHLLLTCSAGTDIEHEDELRRILRQGLAGRVHDVVVAGSEDQQRLAVRAQRLRLCISSRQVGHVLESRHERLEGRSPCSGWRDPLPGGEPCARCRIPVIRRAPPVLGAGGTGDSGATGCSDGQCECHVIDRQFHGGCFQRNWGPVASTSGLGIEDGSATR